MKSSYLFLSIVGVLIILALFGFGGYRYYTLQENKKVLEEDVNELETSLSSTTQQLAKIREDKRILETENTSLSEALTHEEEKTDRLEDKVSDLTNAVGDITSSVNTLEKLSQTDEELLRKYSRVYFLSENYAPESLKGIPDRYPYNKSKNITVHAKVYPYLEDLLDEARDQGIELQIISGYRSFDTQSALKNRYDVIYGEGTANQFSASQGYSEHQLGTTVDFTTPAVGGSFSGFQHTEAYEWLQENAHDYGFTLSYPKDNAYYQYEPWHWRYVGEELATDLYEDDQYFYDVSQRELDEYLVTVFE